MNNNKPKRQKIAIIGAGIAGLTTAYLLNKKHDITVFEKSDRVGGNAYMITTPDGYDIDIAVAAFGMAGYGHFYALLDKLNVKTNLSANTYMSFHNLDTKEGLYLTPTIKAGLRQGFDMLKPKTLKSLYHLFSGIKELNQLFNQEKLTGLNLKEALSLVNKFEGETRIIFLFTLCLLSSMNCEEVLGTPAEFFIKKLMVHHDVISPKFIYSVRTIEGGTKSYINALAKKYKKKIVFKSKIKKVTRTQDSVTLVMNNNKKQKYDKVVFACNADQALKLLDKPSDKEKKILGVWKYKEGQIVVHKDHTSFPSKDLIQAYTFLYTNRNNILNTSVNGALWFEPQVPDHCDLISSQHPNYPIRKDLTFFKTILRTPKFTFDSIKAIPKLNSLNGKMNTYYCGSHFGFGLHNDAVNSAIAVAQHFGVEGPKPKEFSIEKSIRNLISIAEKLRG